GGVPHVRKPAERQIGQRGGVDWCAWSARHLPPVRTKRTVCAKGATIGVPLCAVRISDSPSAAKSAVVGEITVTRRLFQWYFTVAPLLAPALIAASAAS